LWLAAGLLDQPSLAQADDRDLQAEAREAATEALARYLEGAYSHAAALFTRAYELSGHPTQLRNAARALERAGALKEALSAWRKLAELPIAGEAKQQEAQRHTEAIEAQLAAPPAEPPAAGPPVGGPLAVSPPIIGPTAAGPPPEDSTETWRAWLVGSGGAVAATGAALYLSGWVTYWHYQKSVDSRSAVTREDARAADARSAAGLTMVGVGAAVALAGLLWPESPASISPDAVGSGAGLSLRGTW
jgi:tetratricopeptide (TPR) repeat protein